MPKPGKTSAPTARVPRGHRWLSRPSGQSLVEFALILPVMLLLALIALDFGRVYLGWINLQNMARAASNFAANHSEAWLTPKSFRITGRATAIIIELRGARSAPTETVMSIP